MQKIGSLYVSDDLKASLEQEFRDGYRVTRLNAALSFVQNRACAVDIGAHVGSWTVVLAGHFARVFAIEPYSESFACLQRNTEHLDNVTALHQAVGDHASIGTITVRPGKGPLSATVQGDSEHPHAGESLVEVWPLDDIEGIGGARVDFLKVHCNGCEAEAVRGAMGTITSDWPVVLVVVKSRFLERSAQAVRILIGQGYRIAWGIKPDFVLVPPNHPKWPQAEKSHIRLLRLIP